MDVVSELDIDKLKKVKESLENDLKEIRSFFKKDKESHVVDFGEGPGTFTNDVSDRNAKANKIIGDMEKAFGQIISRLEIR